MSDYVFPSGKIMDRGFFMRIICGIIRNHDARLIKKEPSPGVYDYSYTLDLLGLNIQLNLAYGRGNRIHVFLCIDDDKWRVSAIILELHVLPFDSSKIPLENVSFYPRRYGAGNEDVMRRDLAILALAMN